MVLSSGGVVLVAFNVVLRVGAAEGAGACARADITDIAASIAMKQQEMACLVMS